MGCNTLYGNTDIITTRLFNLVDNCMSIYLNIYIYICENSRVSKYIISYKRNVCYHKVKQVLKYFTYDNYVINDN